MEWVIFLIIGGAIAVALMRKTRGAAPSAKISREELDAVMADIRTLQEAKPMNGERGATPRLTQDQMVALSAARFDRPIYGENPALRNAGAQMPDGSYPHSLRTCASLVKRGYLRAGEKGGFFLTTEGEIACAAVMRSRRDYR